jgi:hypothetical protein
MLAFFTHKAERTIVFAILCRLKTIYLTRLSAYFSRLSKFLLQVVGDVKILLSKLQVKIRYIALNLDIGEGK